MVFMHALVDTNLSSCPLLVHNHNFLFLELIYFASKAPHTVLSVESKNMHLRVESSQVYQSSRLENKTFQLLSAKNNTV